MKELDLKKKAWTRSIIKLIQTKEYLEADVLIDYFPQSIESKFLRCAALAGAETTRDLDKMWIDVGLEIETAAIDWAEIFAMNGDLLIEQAIASAKKGDIRIGQLSYEAALITKTTSKKKLLRALCHLLLAGLKTDLRDSIDIFRRFKEFEHSLIKKVLYSTYRGFSVWEKNRALQNLAKHAEHINPILLPIFLDELFRFDLKLHAKDVDKILLQLQSDQSIIKYFKQGLNKQKIKKHEAFTAKLCSTYVTTDEAMAVEYSRSLLAASERRIERHTRILFPSECEIEKKATLTIQLTEDAPSLTMFSEKISVIVGRDARQVEFEVNVTAPAFALKEHKKTMTMPVEGDSEEIHFDLFPMESGRQKIEIEIFHKSCRVGYAIVDTTAFHSDSIFRPTMKEGKAKIAIIENPIENFRESIQIDGPHRRILRVTWSQREGKISYNLRTSEAQDSIDCAKDFPQLKNDIEDHLKTLNEFLNEVVVQGEPSDELWESMCLNLQGYGRQLFKRLIPSEIAAECKQWQPGITVIVSTNENWIPWELLFDGQDFWGKKYCMARYPRYHKASIGSVESRPKTPAMRPTKKVLNVVGGDIPKDNTKKAVRLFNDFLDSGCVKVLKTCPVSAFNKNLPQKDVIHCTCHGWNEPHMLQLSKTKSKLENLLPNTVQQLLLENGCFVFVNACSSNIPVLAFGQFGSFGWEFYRKGAKIFIGTLGSVPTKYAISFAESVYAELFNREKASTIGEAVAHAKENASSNRNLFWLLYMIYGDPDLKFEITG